MAAISPKLGEFLLKTTRTQDLNEALQKIFSEYLELKVKSLEQKIQQFEQKWHMEFHEFTERIREGSLQGCDSLEVEQDFWEWEEAETLKEHYEALKKEWM